MASPHMTLPAPSTASLPRRLHKGPPPPVLAGLINRLDRCPGPIPIDVLRRELAALDLTPADLGTTIQSDAGAYVRTLVHQAPHYELLVMCWMPNQHSPIHDHGGSACAVRVVTGRATETVYSMDDDGLVEPVGQSVFPPRGVVCSHDADIHCLGNLPVPGEDADAPLVTVHIYSPVLGACRKYTPRTPAAVA